MTPVQRRSHGPVLREAGAIGRDQQVGIVLETVRDLLRRQHSRPCRGQLQRERNPSQLNTNTRNRWRVLNRDIEPPVSSPGTFHEQPNGSNLHQLVSRPGDVRVGQLEREDALHGLAGDAEWFPAGSQHVQARTPRQ